MHLEHCKPGCGTTKQVQHVQDVYLISGFPNLAMSMFMVPFGIMSCHLLGTWPPTICPLTLGKSPFWWASTFFIRILDEKPHFKNSPAHCSFTVTKEFHDSRCWQVMSLDCNRSSSVIMLVCSSLFIYLYCPCMWAQLNFTCVNMLAENIAC